MQKKFQKIYQFKITLEGSKPPIWRRIQVPETYSFWEFHAAIQDAMGWEECHLHEFVVVNPKFGEVDNIGQPHEQNWSEVLSERTKKLSSYFSLGNTRGIYVYDFGDGWTHKLVLEKIVPAEAGNIYPKCLAGKRACPPEDCGGIWGYQDLIEILQDPEHPEYEDTLEWTGGPLDAAAFDPKNVVFSDPQNRPSFDW